MSEDGSAATGVHGKNIHVGGDMNVYVNSPTPAPMLATTSFRNVYAPIKSFQGRERLMQEINEKLTDCSGKNNLFDRMLALVGFGGMGKTELTRKFVEVYEGVYPNVAFINAESGDIIKKSFQDLAQILNVPINDIENGIKIAKIVFDHVGEHVPSSLFIFDNANRLHANDFSFGIFEYLPKLKYRNQPLFLITTRTAEWEADNINTLTVDELTKGESVRFLEARFQLPQADPDNGNPKRKDLDSLIDELSDCIQGYPLALQLAAANVNYLPKTDQPELLHSRLKKFITKVKELQDSLMTERVKRGGTDYERTFRIIWSITMQQIDTDDYSLLGRHLLRILAYTDPDGASWKDIKEVFEAHLPEDRNTAEDAEFEEAMHLLKKLVLVHTYEDYRAELAIRMHRMVQSFARRDDGEANGLQCIIEGQKTKLARHHFTSQPKLAIPPAVLRSDELIIAWLRCFIDLSIPMLNNQDGPELEFNSTHELQLKERHSTCVEEIRATVELAKNLKSAEWNYRHTDALTSGIIAYAKATKIESPLAARLLELALQLLRKRILVGMKEPAFLKLKEWLLHPDTAFPPEFYQEGAQLQLLVSRVIYLSRILKWDAEELKRLLHKDYDCVVHQFVIEREIFTGAIVDWEIEQSVEVILSEALEDRFLLLLVVRKNVLKDKKSTKRLLAMKNIHLKLRRYLQALQAELASKWEMISAAGTVMSGNRNPSSELKAVGREAWDLMHDEFKDHVSEIAAHVYTGYIICYSMALCDYDLNGGNFYQMLEKWLPSSEYLITISALTRMPRECNYYVYVQLSRAEWNVDDDIPVLSRAVREIREEKGPEPILLVFHQAVVESLQRINLVYEKCRNAFLSTV